MERPAMDNTAEYPLTVPKPEENGQVPRSCKPNPSPGLGTPEQPPYSVFTARQKKWIIFIAASAGWFSTASSFIYFPAIPFLANDLDVDIQKINLTVTSYLVASGIFPSLVGGAADRYGRRPILVAAVGLYIAVNIGLAIQRDFRALLILRILQSAAISGWF